MPHIMGVLPLQFKSGASAQSLKLDGSEKIDLAGIGNGITPMQDMISGLASAATAIFTGVPALADLTNMAGQAIISGYGRDAELEADRLGARYLAKAGYDPHAMIHVITTLKDQDTFERERARLEGREPRIYHGTFASHPSNDTRLQQAIAAAGKNEASATGNLQNAQGFLQEIEGLPVGSSARQGMLQDWVATTDELFAAGATFTLLAWAFGYVYVVCEAVFPGSFVAAGSAASARTWMELLYLSVAVLSSVGLSDIVPVSPMARAIVMLESVTGVMYIAFVVSSLISMNNTSRRRASRE